MLAARCRGLREEKRCAWELQIRYEPVAIATSSARTTPSSEQPTPGAAEQRKRRLPAATPAPAQPCEPRAPPGSPDRRRPGPGEANAGLGAGPGPARQGPGRRCPRTLAALRVHQAVGDGVGERQQLLGVQELQQVPAPRPLPLAQPRARHGRPARCSAGRRLERAAGSEVPLAGAAAGEAEPQGGGLKSTDCVLYIWRVYN